MNANTTPTIPDTFCPAKWDELFVNFATNYAYSCCKSRPTRFKNRVIEIVSQERQNLLNGIQDPSCDYCWSVEKQGGKSLRHTWLQDFDQTKFQDYLGDRQPTIVEVNVGNECNFQCTYCNPKFSSRWEHDVNQQPYRIFSDRYFYGVDPVNVDVMERNIEFLKTFNHIKRLGIVGGEPLLNKKTFELLESVDCDVLQMATNLSCKKSVLDRLFTKAQDYQSVVLIVSLDATGSVAEFTRHGMNFAEFDSNFRYLLDNRPPNLRVVMHSLMTSVTVRDFENFSKYITPFLSRDGFLWRVEYCKNPLTQSMSTLPDQYKESIVVAIDRMMLYNVWGLDTLKTVISTTPFNRIQHQELKHFMQEFADRKKLTIPLCLD